LQHTEKVLVVHISRDLTTKLQCVRWLTRTGREEEWRKRRVTQKRDSLTMSWLLNNLITIRALAERLVILKLRLFARHSQLSVCRLKIRRFEGGQGKLVVWRLTTLGQQKEEEERKLRNHGHRSSIGTIPSSHQDFSFYFLLSSLTSFLQVLQQGVNLLETHGPTIIICSIVFGTVSFINASMTRESHPTAVVSKGPRPKWEVLRAMNYIVLAVFISSISYATINYHETFAQGATPAFIAMAVLWCLCLGYFFGFFGISFLDQETLQRSPSSLGLSEVSPT
jgi:hypothetical protein